MQELLTTVIATALALVPVLFVADLVAKVQVSLLHPVVVGDIAISQDEYMEALAAVQPPIVEVEVKQPQVKDGLAANQRRIRARKTAAGI